MKSKKFWILFLIIGLPLFVVLSIYVYEHFVRVAPPGLTVDRRLELLREKTIALGHLDNSAYDQAQSFLVKILRDLPDEPLVHRNLALCLFKPDPMSNEGTLSKDETAELEVAIARVLHYEPNEANAQFLAGRVYAKLAELFRASAADRVDATLANARKCFQEAARLAPLDPAPLYDLYLIEKFGKDPDEVLPEQLRALQMARNRGPDNTACLVELLRELMLKGDPEARHTAEQLLRVIPGEADSMHADARPRAALSQIVNLLAGSPNRPPSRAFELHNLVKGDLKKFFGFYQRDLAQLRPHPMVFALEDFRPEFYAGLPADGETPIEVTFTQMTPQAGAGKAGLNAAVYDDLTQDGDWGTVALSTTSSKVHVEVWPDKPQSAMPTIDVEGSFAQLQLADLDLDIRAPMAESVKRNTPADLDLVLFGVGGLRLLENRAEDGKRRWVDRTADCNLPPLANVRWLLCCDVDHDGNLDLIVGMSSGMRILRNRGAWAFDDITNRSTGLETLTALDAVFGDFDHDGDLDLAALGTDGALVTLENLRGGQFRVLRHDVSIPGATCLAAADFNNDGRLDFVIGGSKGATLLLANPTGKDFIAPHADDLVRGPVSKILPTDFDNDGWIDLLMAGTANGARALGAYQNARGGRFSNLYRAGSEIPLLPAPRSLQAADMDNDGDLDVLFLDERGKWEALRNDGGNRNHWLKLQLRAELNKEAAGQGQAAKSNYRCIGGRAEIRSGRHFQLQQVTGTITHFGLGSRKQIDTVRAIWTNGVPQAAIRPNVNESLAENQRVKGSCPYLYTWDGERFVFVTDCLWSSGLGMKQTHGVDMPHERQFNYLVIPGDKLKPRDGQYVLQFTNELWEGPFLDQTQLWVVDHPSDVEIFTNQRVPPDAKEEFKLLTVQRPRYPRAARDHFGRDVLSIVNRRDGQCVGGFRRTRYVGLAEPHWLELDLGDLSSAKTATLLLTGWIWPTDTSANIAISLDPRFAGPTGVIGGAAPPTLQVPDGRGGWATVNPMMGFPSGKMQTVAVPLPLDRFPPGDYRIRVATMMELYWDEAFISVDEPRAEHELRRLPVADADLHYRGYSQILQAAPESPFVYDYDDVDPAPRWLPIAGKYVRYGKVTELLHEPDCRYVAMSPGDEVTLKFEASPPPKLGWKRSFILYANGWLKDFDLNASAGDSAGPYPFDAMSRYPYPRAETHPDQRFVDEYLTREVDGRHFWELLRRPNPHNR